MNDHAGSPRAFLFDILSWVYGEGVRGRSLREARGSLPLRLPMYALFKSQRDHLRAPHDFDRIPVTRRFELELKFTTASGARLEFSLALAVAAVKVWKTTHRVIYHRMGGERGGVSTDSFPAA